jgi:hypothetical protein
MIVGGVNILLALLAILMMVGVLPMSEMIVGGMFLLVALGGVIPLVVARSSG